MLQSLRDNLKGTIAVIVIAIFAVPMVLFGVERLFVGSLGGNDVATVGDTTITRTELNRAIYLQKQRILSETNMDPNADFLKDENLRGPVLESLTRQAALVNAAEEGGMAVSEAALWQEIAQQPQFQNDGVFDMQRFRQLVSNMGYTTATYLDALADGVIVNQQSDGIISSSFLTDSDVQQFAALAQQTRSYFSIQVPKTEVADSIEVTDQEINDYYQQNQDRFRVPEKVALEYVEVDVQTLAERQDVNEEDVRAQYEQEIAAFNMQPQYEVSHILIEDPSNTEKVKQVQQALESGRDFASVAEEFSEDFGTRESGGSLGRLVADAYPKEFEEAAMALEQGEISGPVETEAGVHIIKVDKKTVPEKPTFAERKEDIEQLLRRSLAEQKMAAIREQLDELTYSASDLSQAAEELDLEVKQTELLSRNGDTGLMSYPAVQEAAFSDEVLVEGHNSPVLELPPNRLAVIRVAEHEQAHVQSLEEVRDQVEDAVLADKTKQALADIAEQLANDIRQGSAPEEVAEASGYDLQKGERVTRSDTETDRALVQQLFSMPRPASDAPVVDTFSLPNGDYVVVGLTDVAPGSIDSMDESQLAAMRAQLARQMGSFEVGAYQDQVVLSTEIEME